MSEIIDHLASLTGLRDRDTLDVTLAHAMRDFLAPRRVAVYRLVGDQGEERWLTRAALLADSPAATADPAWVDLDTLPRATERPEWLECLTTAKIIESKADACITTLFPVMSDTGAIGVIELQTERLIGAKMRRLVFGVLRIYRNVQTLLDYSERDTLTGLLNRKIFDDSFYKVSSLPLLDAKLDENERRHAAGSRYWLGVVDIDHFKTVNDRFGHGMGDEALRLVAETVRGKLRRHDLLGRYGGDELALLFPETRLEGAKQVSDRIRRAVAEIRLIRGDVPVQLTISTGIVERRADESLDAACQRADTALYEAKDSGRDCVVVVA